MTDIAHQSKSASVATKKPKPRGAPAEQDQISGKTPKPKFPLPVELFGKIEPQLNRRWLIKGLLAAGASTVIFGSPGAGKSFFAIDIALHVATGRVWFDRDVTQGGVVYVAAEGQAGIRNRIAAWEKLNGTGADVQFALIPASVDLLNSDADFEKLKQTLKMLEESWGSVALVVIDTLAATFGGGDENGHDMTIYVNNVMRLCRPYRCASAIITHSPLIASGPPRPRGHSSLLGAMDTAIYVNEARATESRIAKVTKQKDDDPGQAILFRLVPVEIGCGDDGETVTSCCLMQSESRLPNRRNGKKFSESQSLAFATLQSVMASVGREPTGEIPQAEADGVSRICLEATWRDAFVKEIAKPGTKADTLQKTYRRSRTALIDQGIVRRCGVWVWPAD